MCDSRGEDWVRAGIAVLGRNLHSYSIYDLRIIEIVPNEDL